MQVYAVNFIPLLGSLDMLRVLFVPVAVDTVKNCTPDDGCVKHPKHVE